MLKLNLTVRVEDSGNQGTDSNKKWRLDQQKRDFDQQTLVI